MGTSYMTFQKSAQFSWKELLSRIKQTHGQVNANLSSYYNLDYMAALSSPLLLVELRYHMEEIQQPMSFWSNRFGGKRLEKTNVK